jgi:hypothetical protein
MTTGGNDERIIGGRGVNYMGRTGLASGISSPAHPVLGILGRDGKDERRRKRYTHIYT